MKDSIPYFNSGVIIIPKKLVDIIYNSWKFYINSLMKNSSNFSFIQNNSFYTDQIALCLAIHQNNIPFKELPLEMNFPTHIDLHQNCLVENISPYLIHYHHRITKLNHIRHTWHYENINKIIDKINNKLDSKFDSQIIVDDLYRKILLRPADENGLNYYSNLIDMKKISLNEFEKILYDSDEFKKLKISDKL